MHAPLLSHPARMKPLSSLYDVLVRYEPVCSIASLQIQLACVIVACCIILSEMFVSFFLKCYTGDDAEKIAFTRAANNLGMTAHRLRGGLTLKHFEKG